MEGGKTWVRFGEWEIDRKKERDRQGRERERKTIISMYTKKPNVNWAPASLETWWLIMSHIWLLISLMHCCFEFKMIHLPWKTFWPLLQIVNHRHTLIILVLAIYSKNCLESCKYLRFCEPGCYILCFHNAKTSHTQ